MRITQVATADIGGGAEKVALDLHRKALARGIDSTLAVGNVFSDEPGVFHLDNDGAKNPFSRSILKLAPQIPPAPKKLSPAQINLRRALIALAEPYRVSRVARGYLDTAFPATANILDKTNPELVHLHNLHGSYFDLRELPRIAYSVPTVLTAHDSWLATGHCAYPVHCTKWKDGSECDVCPHMNYPPVIAQDKSHENYHFKRKIFRKTGRRIHLVAPAQWIADQLQASIFEPAIASLRVIPNGIDTKIFKPVLADEKKAIRAQLGIDEDSFVMLFTVAFSDNPYKDATTIMAAIDLLSSEAKQNITFVHLGAHEDFRSHGGVRYLSVPFLKDPRDIAKHLQASNLYVHAAKAEVHPLAILEAQCCGVPAIVTDTGGCKDALASSESGLVVPQEDPRSMAAAIESLIKNPARLNSMAEVARTLAPQKFSLDRAALDYFELYESLIEGFERK